MDIPAKFDMRRVRTRLLLDHGQAFFGTLAFHLETIEDSSVETLKTNGSWIKYNPAFMASLSMPEQVGVLAHEVCHPAFQHPYRRAGRDLREWNEACDYVINGLLLKAGLTLPKGVLHDPQYDGMSAEQVYSKRRSQTPPPPPEPEPEPEPEQEPEKNEDGEEIPGDDGQGQGEDEENEDGEGENGGKEGDGEAEGPGESAMVSGLPVEPSLTRWMPGCPTGEFIDGPETAEEPGELTAQDWEVIAAEAALVASRAGDLEGGIARAIAQTREPRVDWKAETRDFLTSTIESGWSWSRPNRRFISRGLYLPGAIKENVGVIAVAVDVSGSVSQEMLNEFADELTGLLHEARPEKLIAVYCDTRVRGVSEFSPDDPEVELRIPENGGGGTLFQPVFDHVEENRLDPIALVYLTDLEGPAPQEPPYPVLWVTPEWTRSDGPFGRTVRIP